MRNTYASIGKTSWCWPGENIMMMASPYDHNNVVVPIARNLVQTYVREVAEAGQLQHLALHRASFVAELARTLLSEYVIRRQITIAMIDRWLMEAIAHHAQQSSPEQIVRAWIRRVTECVHRTDERLLSPACREALVQLITKDGVCRVYVETETVDQWDLHRWVASELGEETTHDDH